MQDAEVQRQEHGDKGKEAEPEPQHAGVPDHAGWAAYWQAEVRLFSARLLDGDRVSVYPKFEAFDITPLLRVRQRPLRETRFVADAHLGGLARLLRMAGFDTLYDNHYHDREIARLGAEEGRIVLTRDRGLLKRRKGVAVPFAG